MKKLTMSIKFIFLCLTLAIVGCSTESEAGSEHVKEISAVEAEQRYSAKEVVIIDVREQSEWDEEHIPGAIHIPVGELSKRMAELEQYKDSPVVMQCRSGGRSAKGASLLHEAGFKDIYNLEGGIIAWGKAGLSLEKAK